ncbi:MAG: 30S ribosomal protein S1 [Chitinophagia bacterium]|nr:30S ribosomal protein S1 [Chitinophagia bacterium]
MENELLSTPQDAEQTGTIEASAEAPVQEATSVEEATTAEADVVAEAPAEEPASAPEVAPAEPDVVAEAPTQEPTNAPEVAPAEPEAVTEAPEAQPAPEVVAVASEAVAPVPQPEAAATQDDVFAEAPKKNIPKLHKFEQQAPATAHDDFDWSIDKRNVAHYSKAAQLHYDQLYTGTFKTINENELMIGTVEGLTKTDVVVNIGFKSDGLVSLNEFREEGAPRVGDTVEVMVVQKEDRGGHLHLSRKLARAARSWQQIVDFFRTGEVVTGTITSKTKGGLIVDVHGLETFLPGSQIDVKPVSDYDQYVGKTMDFKVVKINEHIRNAVVSHKALIESELEQQRSVIIGQLEKGQILEGTVKNVTDFGAFIDLGGVDGLLYITDISWGRVSHPSEVLHNNMTLNVVVLDFDDEKKRISLGLKQLTPHPWDSLPDDTVEGTKVKGRVVNIEDYGAFLEIMPGVEGLVHVSEISWSSTPVNAKEYFKANAEYEAVIVTLDKAERKMSLSIKQHIGDPWATIEERYPVDSRHQTVVKNITPFGVFVELEVGIGGMIHISELNWIKRFNHPSEYVKVGDKIEVLIMGIDKENRKLSLGHKQLEEDPWNTFEDVFPINSVHEGMVIRKDEKGAAVQLQYGLEAFAPIRHLRQENGDNVEAEETVPFMIIEFDRNERRILVSHTKVWEQARMEEKEAAKKAAAGENEKTAKAVKNIQNKVEKPTLGDLSALASLKDKLKKAEDDEKNEK